MSNDSFIALVSNVSLLVVMVLVCNLVNAHLLNLETKLRQAMTGAGLNMITTAVMAMSWAFEQGGRKDDRSSERLNGRRNLTARDLRKTLQELSTSWSLVNVRIHRGE